MKRILGNAFSGPAALGQATLTSGEAQGRGLNAIDMLWGNGLVGRNEQALAAAVAAANGLLKHILYIPFPWSLYQAAQVRDKQGLIQRLEKQLLTLLQAATQAKARYVVTGYAGADLDWASETIGGFEPITAVFSCLLTNDFRPPNKQRWHPIALPCAQWGEPEVQMPVPYQHLLQIWQAIQSGEAPTGVPQGNLLLPGNPALWQDLFAGQSSCKDGHQGTASKAAQLIAEEHGGNRCVMQILRTLSSSVNIEAFVLDANNLILTGSAHPEFPRKSRQDQITFALNLKHSHRTPLAYRQIADRCPHLCHVSMSADIVMTGCPGEHNGGSRSLCISEEPLWDLRRRAGRYTSAETGYLNGFFDDLPIPYYLAINPLILDRLSLRLEHMAARSIDEILCRLIQADVGYLGIHEFRLRQERTGTVHSTIPRHWEILPLSQLRTKIGIHARARGLGHSHGKGWGRRGFQGLRRNAYTDWHLDKLQLIRSTGPKLGMAIENVHVHSYVTEKTFDMLCFGVVPITYASPSHVLHGYLEPQAHLNTYGRKLGDILQAIEHFQPDEATAKAIHRSASRLANLFGSSEARASTLDRVAERCEQWVLRQCYPGNYRDC